MPARKPSDPNAKTRLERITEIAHEAECNEDEAAFREKLGQIARVKPKGDSEPSDRKTDR